MDQILNSGLTLVKLGESALLIPLVFTFKGGSFESRFLQTPYLKRPVSVQHNSPLRIFLLQKITFEHPPPESILDLHRIVLY